MATESDYEPSVTPAGFVASRHQSADPHPGMSFLENSILRSPNAIDMDGQNDNSQYGDDRAVTDKVYRSRARGDSNAMGSRFSVEYLHNRSPHALQVLMDTLVNE